MNFCVAILILKMEENMQHFQHIMLYYFKKGKNNWNARKDLCSVRRMCYDWLNLLKLANFCVAILILKVEENMQHFGHIMLYYFKKGKNTTEMQKKKGSCSVWRRCCDLSNVSKVVCEVSCYYWHFGQVILCCGAVLCIGRCLAALLASTH